MADVTLSYKGSDILELSDSGSATLKTGGTYCEADIEVEYVKPSGGGVTPVTALILHTGNAFDFDMQLNPSIHKIKPIIGQCATTGGFSTGLYCSLSSSNAFFAVAGRNGNYNRWQYGAYGSDNYMTNPKPNSVQSIFTNPPFSTGFTSMISINFSISYIGDGSIGTGYTEVPQTETLLHVGNGLNGSLMYRFYIYDTEQSKFLQYWIPALDSSGTPCFYDCVNEKYIYNSGTGELGYTLVDVGL